MGHGDGSLLGANVCLFCHGTATDPDGGADHEFDANPFRLKNYDATSDGWNSVCLVCHKSDVVTPYDPDGPGGPLYDEPIMINSIRPHMHLHGVGQSVEVIWPVRERDYLGHTASPGEMLSAVNNYDHNWQTSYSYQEQARPLLPKGTALMFRTHFDNTANNPNNPDPDQWVYGGSRTGDEMSHAWIAVTHLDEEGYEELLAERMVADAD